MNLINEIAYSNYPVVMCFSGHDATAGAGIAADIATLISLGCHPSPIVTTITVQDTINVKSFTPLPADLVISQAHAILADLHVAAFKIGMIGSVANVEAIYTILRDYPQLPVILDPILTAGGGKPLADNAIKQAIIELLLPLTTVLTPNSQEARALTTVVDDNLDTCAQQILAHGCQHVLITGTHEHTESVINTLYSNDLSLEKFSWERLSEVYHGSGCTLAAAIAGFLAHGLTPFNAIREAQTYTWSALRSGYRLGKGQFFPNRLFLVKTNQ